MFATDAYWVPHFFLVACFGCRRLHHRVSLRLSFPSRTNGLVANILGCPLTEPTTSSTGMSSSGKKTGRDKETSLTQRFSTRSGYTLS